MPATSGPSSTEPVEWAFGSTRHSSILQALEHATDSRVSLYRNGRLQWTADVAGELHELTCHAVQKLLEGASSMRLPVYLAEASGGGDVNAAAISLAQQQAQSEQNSSLEQVTFQLPDSFAAALACKRRWLAGEAAAQDIQQAAERLLDDLQFYWPSNFCLQVNGLQTAAWCVLSALNLGEPWLAAYGCAQCTASFLGARAGCQAIHCAQAAHSTTELVWEAAQIGDLVIGRGVGCPQAGHPEVEQQATAALQITSQDVWQQLNDDLVAAVLAKHDDCG